MKELKVKSSLSVKVVVFSMMMMCWGAAAMAVPSVVNGNMSEGGETPDGWTLTTDEGQLRMFRDTADFSSAPASLRLESVGGRAKGNVNQRINLSPGQTVAVSGKVKAEGNIGYAAFVMMAIGGNPAWNPIKVFSKQNEWQEFSHDFTVPNGSQFVLLMLFMDGDGKVWLDDLEVTGR